VDPGTGATLGGRCARPLLVAACAEINWQPTSPLKDAVLGSVKLLLVREFGARL